MSGRVRSVKILFLIRVVLFFAFFYLLWYYLSPFYNGILTGVSGQVVRLSETGGLKVTRSIVGVEKEIWIYHIAAGSPVTKYRGDLVHFDMVLLFALIWAVPNVNVKKRLKIFLLGGLIIYGVHVVKLFVYVKHTYASYLIVHGTYYFTPLQKAVYGSLKAFFIKVGNQAIPVLIWSLLYVNHWWIKRPELRAR